MGTESFDTPFNGEDLVFIDCETSGLDPDRHDIWNLALLDCKTGRAHEWLWHIDKTAADPGALRMNNFYQVSRERSSGFSGVERAAEFIAPIVAGKKLAGMNPAFDARFLEKTLREYGEAAAWDYHLIDVEAVMFGALAQDMWLGEWSSSAMARAVGVSPEPYGRHTAMGDALWAHDCLAAVLGLERTGMTHGEQ